MSRILDPIQVRWTCRLWD